MARLVRHYAVVYGRAPRRIHIVSVPSVAHSSIGQHAIGNSIAKGMEGSSRLGSQVSIGHAQKNKTLWQGIGAWGDSPLLSQKSSTVCAQKSSIEGC